LRSTNGAASDPLQYLHNMAEQVGKEVDLFAERVDLWHTRGNESKRAKYQATMTMIDDFKDVAATRVKELKKEHEQEHKTELSHSVRRRVEKMAKGPNPSAANAHEGSRRLSTQSADSDDEEFEAERKGKVENLRQWQAELATWELVQIIVEHHHPEPETDPAATRQERLATVGGNKRYSPNSEVWDRFLLEDDKAKEKAIILRWLEQTAQNDRSGLETMTEVIQAQAERNVSTWTNGWLDTKVTIQQAKRLENIEKPLQPGSLTLQTRDKTQDLVTQLDPDAPARQKRALEQKDEYYERSMWMVCYEMLRRGLPWKDICEWAQEKNEAWRGVSVGAAYEAHPNGGPNLAGPTVGFLFRRTCFYAARGARSPYEAAVYGLLSGDLKQAQTHPACQSWHDHLYAHYNALLLSRFDTYLLQNHPHRVPESMTAKFLFQDAVTHIGNWETASEQVIDLLKRQKGMEGLSTKPFALLQGALIGRKLSALMIQVGLAIADMQNDDERPFSLLLRPDTAGALEGMESVGNERLSTTADCYKDLARNPHTLRILTHLFIIFHGVMGRQREPASADPNNWMAMDNVVTTYIEFLRVTKKLDLIPLYAAQLTPERAGHCLARVLPDIKNHDEQRRSVALMEAYGIDVVEVTVQMFQYACHLIGFTHLVGFKANGDSVVGVTNPIKRFKILEPTPSDNVLWPGFRIQHVFEGSDIEPAEEALIEALQWYHYTSNDFDQTFQHMWHALSILLRMYRFIHPSMSS
jgi:nuclear pore complex protein Nup107